MDTLTQLICLLLGAALPLTAGALLVRRGMRQLAVANAYQEVARDLGLQVDTRGISLRGHLGDRRIWVGDVMEGHGPERRVVTRGLCSLTRPLGLGLYVKRKGMRHRLRDRLGTRPVLTGDPDADAILEIHGDDPERLRALLTPELTRSLMGAMERWPGIVLTDHHVHLMLRSPEASMLGLRSLVDTLVKLAEQLEVSRQQVEVPPGLRDRVLPWTSLGKRLGLEVEPHLPALAGTLDGYRVQAVPRRERDGYFAEVQIFFTAPHQLGMRIWHQNEPAWAVSGQDILVGDEAFDDAFVIKGYDPQEVRERLLPEVREALLHCTEFGRTELDEASVRVRNVPLEESSIETVLRALVTTATGLGFTPR